MKHVVTSRPNMLRRGFTLVELLVVIAIIGILVGLTIPAVQAARESGRQAQCTNNLHNFGVALTSYEGSNKKFPEAIDAGGYTWITKLLPQLEQNNRYEKFDLTVESWHANNRAVIEGRLEILECPSDAEMNDVSAVSNIMMTSYSGSEGWISHKNGQVWQKGSATSVDGGNPRPTGNQLTGSTNKMNLGGVFRPNSKTVSAAVKDGFSNTVYISEVTAGGFTLLPDYNPASEADADRSGIGSDQFLSAGVARTALSGVYGPVTNGMASMVGIYPEYDAIQDDAGLQAMTGPIGATALMVGPVYQSFYGLNTHFPGASSAHPQVVLVMMGDGSTKKLVTTIDNAVWKQLNGIDDGTVIDSSAL